MDGNIPQQQFDDEPGYSDFQRLGDCYTSVGHFSQAQACYETAAELEPDESDPYLGLGAAALQQDKLDDAELAFRVAVRLDKNSSKAYCGLAMVAQKRGDYEQSFELYLKSLELDTDNLTAFLGLFQTSCRMGTFSRLIHYLEVYLQAHPSDSSVMFSLATLYVREGRLFQARKMLRQLVSVDPENSDAADLLVEVEHDLVQKTAPANAESTEYAQ